MKTLTYKMIHTGILALGLTLFSVTIEAKSLQHSKQQIKAKKIIVILKYMDKHGCKMQKQVHEMVNLYVHPIFTQTKSKVTCATYGRVEGKGCSVPTTEVMPNRPYTCVVAMDALSPGMGL